MSIIMCINFHLNLNSGVCYTLPLTVGVLIAQYNSSLSLACNSPLLPGVLVLLGLQRHRQHLDHLGHQSVPCHPAHLSDPEVVRHSSN